MMKRFLVVLFAMALSGCLTYDSYGYRDDGYYEDRYDNGGRYYADSPYSAGRGYSRFDYPDYVLWPRCLRGAKGSASVAGTPPVVALVSESTPDPGLHR